MFQVISAVTDVNFTTQYDSILDNEDKETRAQLRDLSFDLDDSFIFIIQSCINDSDDQEVAQNTEHPVRDLWRARAAPPTLAEVENIFNLNSKQQFVLRILLNNLEKKEQILIGCYGSPGTGKSYVHRALVYYLYHTGKINNLATSSYSARAAASLRTTVSNSYNSCKLFGIHPRKGEQFVRQTQVKQLLERVQLLATDEISFTSPQVLALMSKRPSQCRRDLDSEKPFGGLSHIIYGDFFQLLSIGTNLTTSSYSEFTGNFIHRKKILTNSQISASVGRIVFNSFDYVVYLNQQMRTIQTPSGKLSAKFCEDLRNGPELMIKLII
jgi:hypothetical protein